MDPPVQKAITFGVTPENAPLQRRPATEAPLSVLIPSGMAEQPESFCVRFGNFVNHAEVVSYALLAILLLITVLAAITSAGKSLWDDIGNRTVSAGILQVLDKLLVVLMVIEILHTVRISIRSHVLVTEPFLIVDLIASIRRVLVISLEAAALTKSTAWSAEAASVFRALMIELGLLGALILILVFSITLLRRYAPAPKDIENL
jgi:hypothetical protein